MATLVVPGQLDWRGEWDEEGNRIYRLKQLIISNDSRDGPAVVSTTFGIPLPGNFWLVDNDIDLWSWCRADRKITPLITRERNFFWEVETRFSTKPSRPEIQRCHDQSIEDPLSEIPKVSGSFVKYTKEASYDRNGLPILSSSFEQMRGPQVEFDANRPTIKIEQNVATPALAYVLPILMMDTVNATTLWGLPPRTIKLSNASWERVLYGLCYLYYKRTLEFDINFETFDRNILDEGTKVLRGEWDYDTPSLTYGQYLPDGDADPANPQDFVRFKDFHGENTRAVLNGAGLPIVEGETPGTIHVEKYTESDFYSLGIPTIF